MPSLNTTTNPVLATPTEKTKQKEKKYACERCINKKFTTKQSIKRYYKTFLTPKQFLKQTEETAEISTPTITSPTKRSNIKTLIVKNLCK